LVGEGIHVERFTCCATINNQLSAMAQMRQGNENAKNQR